MMLFDCLSKDYITQSEAEMNQLAYQLFNSWNRSKFLCYLSGDLGTGKTTFVRAFLTAAGVKGSIKSPSYSIIELYELTFSKIAHIDLYRLSGIDDIEGIGLPEILEEYSCFIEWPGRISFEKLRPDITISFKKQDETRYCCDIELI